jgi:hypothetical protein
MTVKLTKQEQYSVNVANAILTATNATAEIDKNCQAIRKERKGKPLGTVKSGDSNLIRFVEILTKAGKAEQTIKNLATAFRKAVNDGVPFSMNAYRAKAKGAQTAPKGSSASGSTIRLEVKGEPKVEELSGALRKFLNKLKGQDQYAQLASFMLDGLDEFDGE